MSCSCGCMECTCQGRCICPQTHCLCTSCYMIRENACSLCGRPPLNRRTFLLETRTFEWCNCFLSDSEVMSATPDTITGGDAVESSGRRNTLCGENKILPIISIDPSLSNIHPQDTDSRSAISDRSTVINISDCEAGGSDQSEKAYLPIIPLYETEVISEQVDSQDKSYDGKTSDCQGVQFGYDLQSCDSNKSQCIKTRLSSKLPSDRVSPNASNSSTHDPDSSNNFSEYTSKSLISSDDDAENCTNNSAKQKYIAKTTNSSSDVKSDEKNTDNLSPVKPPFYIPPNPMYYVPSTRGLSAPMSQNFIPPPVPTITPPFYCNPAIPNVRATENPISDSGVAAYRGTPFLESRIFSYQRLNNPQLRVCYPRQSEKSHFEVRSNIMNWLDHLDKDHPNFNRSRPGSSQEQSNNDSDSSKEMHTDIGIGSATEYSVASADVNVSLDAGLKKCRDRRIPVADSSTSSSSSNIRTARALCQEVNKIIDNLGDSLKDIAVESKDSSTDIKANSSSDIPEKSSDSENVLSENYAGDLSSDAPSSQD